MRRHDPQNKLFVYSIDFQSSGDLLIRRTVLEYLFLHLNIRINAAGIMPQRRKIRYSGNLAPLLMLQTKQLFARKHLAKRLNMMGSRKNH